MEETIKGKEVIAYKGMNSDMSCGYFQYEVGKTYKTDKAELNECGFHACLNPIDVLYYYYQEESSRYFKVKLFGEITKCDEFDTKVAATEITILEEINIKELRNITEWWKNENVLDLLYFSDGFARVRRNDKKYNYIDEQGKLLSEQLFEKAFDFNEGFAVVEKPIGLMNFINKDGKIISDEWFELVGDFCEGFAEVKRTNGNWVKIDKTGKLIKNYNRIWEKLLKIYNRLWKRFI